MEGLLAVVPDAYRPTYRQLSFNGGRVLALARRALPTTTDVMEARNWPRDAVERDLEFAGFLVLDCPMKPDSRRVLKELRESKHRLVMITGDNPLTAVDVAKKVRRRCTRCECVCVCVCGPEDDPVYATQVGIMTTTQRTLVLMVDTPPASTAHPTIANLYWNDLSAPEADRRDIRVPFDVAGVADMLSGSQVAVTGAAIGTLLDAAAGDGGANSAVNTIANSAAVFARMSPRNKEILVARMNSLGHTTLMCGDGTNDVGALTQAHIGECGGWLRWSGCSRALTRRDYRGNQACRSSTAPRWKRSCGGGSSKRSDRHCLPTLPGPRSCKSWRTESRKRCSRATSRSTRVQSGTHGDVTGTIHLDPIRRRVYCRSVHVQATYYLLECVRGVVALVGLSVDIIGRRVQHLPLYGRVDARWSQPSKCTASWPCIAWCSPTC